MSVSPLRVATRGYIGVGSVSPAPNPSGGGGGVRFFPAPTSSKTKKKRETLTLKSKRVIHQPRPEYEISGPLGRQTQLEHYGMPAFDEDKYTAALKTLKFLEMEEREVKRKKAVDTAMLLMLLD